MRKISPIILLLVLCLSGYSQASSDESPVSNTVYEKVYLHVDREAYAPGDDIWFKVYLVSGISNRLIDGYKNIYIHLINEEGAIVDDRLVMVIRGVATGDFELPGNMEEGQYTLRAFTKYQKNFGEESYFHKKIWISAMKRQIADADDKDSLNIDVGFYPESGNLVLNASNSIAFKAINNKGYGIAVSGLILDDLNDTITPFRSDFLGMGKFALMPAEGRTYRAILTEYPGFTYEFSDLQADGITLQYRDELVSVKFGLARNFTVNDLETYILTASHKGIELFNREIVLSSFYNEIEVPKQQFPLGISKITVQDASGLIQAERLVFIYIDMPPMIIVKTTKEEYEPRSTVRLEITSLLPETDTMISGVSLSVVNKDYLTGNGYTKDIRSYLLLDSELKGPIENSAFYFSSEGGMEPSEKLDLLMMVQGWRSYYWPEIIENIPDKLMYWADIGLSVEGHVKRFLRDKTVIDGEVIIGPFSSSFTFVDTYTDEEGRYRFDRLFLRDSALLIVQAKTMTGSKRTEVYIDKIYVPEKEADIGSINAVIRPPLIQNSYYGQNFSKLEAERKYAIESGTYWIDEVEVIGEEKAALLDLKNEAKRMYGEPERRFEITEEDYTYFNLLDYLENRVPGIVVSGESISIRGGGTPLFLLDDIIQNEEIFDITTLPMADIEHVDLFYSGAQTALFGSQGGNGVIAIYTRRGTINTDFTRYIKGRTTIRVNGFQRPRKFYAPTYNLQNIDHEMPDYRPTLYWDPFVEFEGNKAEIEFCTSDFISTYIVIAEGISKNGTICTGMGSFDVTR